MTVFRGARATIALFAILLMGADQNSGEFRRIHPRTVTASSYLQSQWNRFDDNYLPIYAVDDNPKTAWVEGRPGLGVDDWIEWIGPHLKQAQQVKLRIRAGYHKSKSLYRKNGRPRQLHLQPLSLRAGRYAPAGRPKVVSLPDTMRRHEVALAVPPNFAGLRMTIRSTYAGSRYADTCLSDIEVYVRARDTYRPALESQIFERVQGEIVERVQLARTRHRRRARFRLADRYVLTSTRSVAIAPKQDLESLGTSVAIADKTVPDMASLRQVRRLIDRTRATPSNAWRLVMADGSPRLSAQLVAALPVLRQHFVGLYELGPMLDRRAVKLQELAPQAWRRGRAAWTDIEPMLLYEVILNPLESRNLVNVARSFGYRGTFKDAFDCQMVQDGCMLRIGDPGADTLVSKMNARFGAEVRVLGDLREPLAIRASARRTLGSGRDGSPGAAERDELLVYREDGLPAALFLITRLGDEGARGPDHAQLVLFDWAPHPERRRVLVPERIAQVHLIRPQRPHRPTDVMLSFGPKPREPSAPKQVEGTVAVYSGRDP